MQSINILATSLILALAGTSCSRQVSDGGPNTTTGGLQTSSSGASGDNTYVLDFSNCSQGSVAFHINNGLAFTIDLSQKVRSYAFQANQYQIAPDLNSSNDGGTCPIDKFSEPIAEHVATIEPGQDARVLWADLEIKGGDPGGYSKICFGYRSLGQWHWDPALITITYDTSGGGRRLHMPIDKGPIDALYLATTAGTLAIGKLTYTVAPQ